MGWFIDHFLVRIRKSTAGVVLCILVSMLSFASAKAGPSDTELRKQISILADPRTHHNDAQDAMKLVVSAGSQAIPGLLEVLSNTTSGEFPDSNILTAFGEIGDDSTDVINALLNNLPHYDRAKQKAALNSLFTLGPKGAKAAVDHLTNWLLDPSVAPKSKKFMLFDIGNLGAPVIPYLDLLISGLPRDPTLQQNMAQAIGSLKATTPGSKNLLRQLLAPDSSRDDAKAALSAISDLREKAVEFVPLITALSNRNEKNSVENLQLAIEPLGHAAGPALIQSLRNGDALWERQEEYALSSSLGVPMLPILGSIGLSILPGLRELARHKSATPLARRRAIQSLEQISKRDKSLVSTDRNVLASLRKELREAGYVDLLERIISENSEPGEVRSAAGHALISFGTKDTAKLNAAFLSIEDYELDLQDTDHFQCPPLNQLSPALVETLGKGTDKKILFAADIITKKGSSSTEVTQAIEQAIRKIANSNDAAPSIKSALLRAYKKSLGDKGSIDVEFLNGILSREKNSTCRNEALKMLENRPATTLAKFIPGLIGAIDDYDAVDLLEKVGETTINPTVKDMRKRQFANIDNHIYLLHRLIKFESAQNALIETVGKAGPTKYAVKAADSLSSTRKIGLQAILSRISLNFQSVEKEMEPIEDIEDILSIAFTTQQFVALLPRFPLEDAATITSINDLLRRTTPSAPLQRYPFINDPETWEDYAQQCKNVHNAIIGGQLSHTLNAIVKRHEEELNTNRLPELKMVKTAVEEFRQRYPVELFKNQKNEGGLFKFFNKNYPIIDNLKNPTFNDYDGWDDYPSFYQLDANLFPFYQFDKRILEPMRISVRYLENISPSPWDSVVKYAQKDTKKFWSAVGTSAALGGLALIWLTLYWVRPLTLLTLANFVKLPETINVKVLAIRSNRMADLLIYRPRVLDAWVREHLGTAREAFGQLETVRARHIHIPLPVGLDGETVADLTPAELRPVFARKRALLLIHGEGGSGKTSLACQIALWAISGESPAPHPMLPILVEHDIEAGEGDTVHPLSQTVQGLLSRVYDLETDIPMELLDRLMRRRRLLVIVDHLSEMNGGSRDIMNPAAANFPASALIITSRQRETLDNVPMSRIMPTRIAGSYVSDFLGAYLRHLDRRQDFDDSSFFDACAKLTRVVGDRDITVLLAKIYADQLVMALDSGKVDKMATDVPNLMLDYVVELNRNKAETAPTDINIIADIKVIAWMCLKKTGRPMPAARADILAAMDGEDSGARLAYIQEKLLLLHAPDPSGTRLTFVLDPVAEYFAAMKLFDLPDCDAPCASATAFLDDLPSPANEIEEFLLSIRDCSKVLLQDPRAASGLADRINSLI